MEKLSRRAVLRGVGAAVALPWLESMAPAAGLARADKAAPTRMAFFYVPNGVHMPDWTPAATGSEFELPWILEPLAPVKNDLLVLSGLAQDGAYAHGDGGGDHARGLACFLTGVHPVKTDGADIRVGVSVDQLAAQAAGKHTRFPSLELGIERGAQSGNCDSGYSCAYSSNIAWRSPTQPVAKEVDPRLVFERLFGTPGGRSGAGGESRRKYGRSVLDFVAEDARALDRRLGAGDRRKVDEYLGSLREIERRLAFVEGEGQDTGLTKPGGIPEDHRDHIRLMLDLLVVAFRADLTRIATFLFANEGSNRSYGFLDVPEGHHELSHHGGDAAKHAKIRKINRFHVELFAEFLARLKAVPEGDGTLLDHAMIVYGSGIGDGNRHNHDHLPILLAGSGCGTIRPARHVDHGGKTPLNNLYLSMLDRMDAPAESLGDSTGRLGEL